MDDKRLIRYLQEYQALETRFVEITKYIPLVSNLDAPNYAFPSQKAADFGLECATWLETLMTELLNDPRVDSYPDIEKLRRNPNIDAYRMVFTEKLGFAIGGWRLKVGGDEIWPFKSWGSGENPEWFRIYSKYKHNRIALAEKWTIKHTLMVFIAITILIQHWKKPSNWDKKESKILEGVIY